MKNHRHHRRRWLVLLAATTVLTTAAATLSGPAWAITGGTPVSRSQYPYVVEINGNQQCTGTIIGSGWILTAAHCVWAATGDLTVGMPNGQNVAGTEIWVHPLWSGDALEGHDLALVRVPPNVTAGITPIQVGQPFEYGPYMPQEATIIGFGETGNGAGNGGTLRAADTPLRSDTFMSDIFDPWWWFDNWVEDLMIGAGSTGQNACHGDSGGPLVVRAGTSHPIQVGVASFVWPFDECATASGYMELNGPQLAWVASRVPGVAQAWGDPCVTVYGTTGHPVGTYDTSGSSPNMDGPYHWSVKCDGPPAPPRPPQPPHTPGPEDPPPPGCTITCVVEDGGTPAA